MKNKGVIIWSAVGSVTLMIIGFLAIHFGPGGGFWGVILDVLNRPAVYLYAMLVSYFYGTVEGPTGLYRIFFMVYLVAVGFFVGYLMNIFFCRVRKKRINQNLD